MNYKNMNTFELKKGALIEYLVSLGIAREDVFSFINKPNADDYEDPSHLDNIDRIVESLHEGFEADKEFFLQVDSDVDGYTSASIFYLYFTSLYPNAKITWRIHDEKEHGVILNTIPVWMDYVIIPDAGSNQLEEQEELSRKGIKVLIMDHHNVDYMEEYENCIIVNNQTSKNFSNKSLSGAGVVYKVIEMYDRTYNFDRGWYKEYEDLAALGIISDMMDTRTLDNNAIIYGGLHNVKNKMLAALLAQQEYKVKSDKSPNKIDIAFYVAPLINAVIRSGTRAEKEDLFRGFITRDSTEDIVTIYRGIERHENLYKYLARTSSNLRNRQNSQKEKSLASICGQIEDKHLDDNAALILKISNTDVPQTITGLVAMEISKIYNKPTLVLRPVLEDGEMYYRGSGRASAANGFSSFAKVLQESGLVQYAQGHDMAFGASVKEKDIDALTKYLNHRLEGVDFKGYNEVDCCVTKDNWDNQGLMEFADAIDMFGNGIPQPKFHFSFKGRDLGTIQGKNSDSLKIKYKDVAFVAFKNKDLVEQYEALAKNKNDIQFEIIGRAQVNEWMGYRNINIMIDDIDMSLSQQSNALF